MKQVYVYLGLFITLSHPISAMSDIEKVRNLTGKESEVVSMDMDMNKIYPRTIRILGQSLHASDKNYDAYLQFTAKVNNPGYKKQNVSTAIVNDNLYAVSFIRFRDDFPSATGKPLDLYISGKTHFFTIRLANGESAYTYDGRFQRDGEGYLETVAQQDPVLNKAGEQIQIPPGPLDQLGISPEGNLFFEGRYIDSLGITSFNSTNGLWTYEGTVFYVRDPNRSKKINSKSYEVKQGYYEASNEIPGMSSGKMIIPFYEGTVHATRTVMKSYTSMFKATGTDR